MSNKVIDIEDDIRRLQVVKPSRACTLLDVSGRTLHRMIKDGRLDTVQLGPDPRQCRITRESIERLLGGDRALGQQG